MVKICPICGEKIKIKVKVKDGIICSSCSWLSPNHKLESIEIIKSYWNENQSRSLQFSKTSMLKGFMTDSIVIDDINQLLFFGKEATKSTIYYSFDEVSEYHFEQVGGKIITKSKGGVGKAVVGGVLFGGVGAIVGASTSKKETKTVGGVNTLKIVFDTHFGKITKALSNPPTDFIPFLDKCINDSKTSLSSQIDGADEIVKFKSLLDQGIITEQEFNAKKKQILGL